jgi:DNA-directed RNA polymerase specialized sigma24 family protein
MTDKDFRRFLAWLSPDPERAARRYTELHLRLTRGFARTRQDEACRLADETLDRAIGKAQTVAVGYRGDPACYVWAIARRILLEQARSQRRRWRRAERLAWALPSSAVVPDEDQERHQLALERSLDELRPDERSFILTYYAGQGSGRRGRRRALAGQARVSAAAVRKRTQRIRERLRARLVALPGQAMGGGT